MHVFWNDLKMYEIPQENKNLNKVIEIKRSETCLPKYDFSRKDMAIILCEWFSSKHQKHPPPPPPSPACTMLGVWVCLYVRGLSGTLDTTLNDHLFMYMYSLFPVQDEILWKNIPCPVKRRHLLGQKRVLSHSYDSWFVDLNGAMSPAAI